MPKLSLKPFALTQPARNQKQMCQLCSQAFGLTKREHLCKRCYRFVCDSCAPHKMKTYRADMQVKMHRLCNMCYTQSQILRRYSQSSKLQWAVDSEISRIWIKQIENNLTDAQQKSRVFSKNKFQNKKKITIYQSTIEELWSSFNYTFRQLVGLSIDRNSSLQQILEQQKKKDKQKSPLAPLYTKILEQILQLLSITISGLNQDNTQPQCVIYILIFFLVHSSPSSAIILTRYTVNILTENQISVSKILSYLKILRCSQNQIDRMENFIEFNSPYITKLGTINYFSVQISIQIISSLILKRDFLQMQKLIAFIAYKRKEFIIKNETKSDLISIDILRNLQGLGDGYKKFIKLCEGQQQSPQKSEKNLEGKQGSLSKVAKNKKTYQQLVQQNEQLKIKNKNHQEEIIRLRKQNSRLMQRQKKLFLDMQSKDTCRSIINKERKQKLQGSQSEDQSQQNDQFADTRQFTSTKKQGQLGEVYSQENGGQIKKRHNNKQRMNQHNRGKRMTTVSETKESNKSMQQSGNDQIYNYQKAIYSKNQQILSLRKQIQSFKKKLTSLSGVENFKELQKAKKQNQELSLQLTKKQQMNQKLLQKMKQLSNMLMDKQEELVIEQKEKSQQFYQLQLQSQKREQQCNIF